MVQTVKMTALCVITKTLTCFLWPIEGGVVFKLVQIGQRKYNEHRKDQFWKKGAFSLSILLYDGEGI
jgi:hypothetical protein